MILVTDVTKLIGTVPLTGSVGLGSSGSSSGDGVLSLEASSVGSTSADGRDADALVNANLEPADPVRFSQDGVLEHSSATVKSVIWSGVNIPRLSSCSKEFCLLSIK